MPDRPELLSKLRQAMEEEFNRNSNNLRLSSTFFKDICDNKANDSTGGSSGFTYFGTCAIGRIPVEFSGKSALVEVFMMNNPRAFRIPCEGFETIQLEA